MKVYLKQMI